MSLMAIVGVGYENLMLKVQDTTATAGNIEVRYDPGAGRVVVSTYAPNEGSIVRGQFTQQFQPGDHFGARADSVGAVRVFRNGVIVGQVDVSSWAFATEGGRIGISALGLNGGGVLDDFGGGDASPVGESPPRALITLPLDGSTYYSGQTVNLSGSGLDVESRPQQLQFGWTVDLYHNNHIHPSVYTFAGPHAAFPGVNHDDGTGVHMLVKLTATDPQGQASDTAYAAIWPEIDLRTDPIQVDPVTPIETQSALYTLVIHNDGRMPAPISHWALLANDVALAQGDTVIRALDSLRVVVKTALPTAGFWTLRLVADSTNTVHELDEADNVSLQALTVVRATTGVPAMLPARLELSLPAPNPSHGEVSFALALPREAEVELRIIDLQGRVVHQEAKRRYLPGRWSLTWDGRIHGAAAAPGVYLARIRIGETAFTRRIALIR